MGKKYDIDIFEAMKQADRKNYKWFSGLSDKEKNAFEPWLLMRFMSSGPDDIQGAANLIYTNLALNENFNVVYKHKELFYKLMCTTGSGRPTKRYMPKPPKKRKASPIVVDLIVELQGEVLTDQEIKLFLINNDITGEDLEFIAYDIGWTDSKIKEIQKSYDNLMAE